MKTSTGCERVRMAMMAALDGESGSGTGSDREHLATCASCQQWVDRFAALNERLRGLPYQGPPLDLWPAVEQQILDARQRSDLPRRLWPIAAGVLAWRALQLFIDLPLPILHPLVPLVATIWAIWLVAGELLVIETSAPELGKRGA